MNSKSLSAILVNSELIDQINALRRPVAAISLLTFLGFWLILFLGLYLTWNDSVWFALSSVVVFGACQRGLGNLQHDATHYTLFLNRKYNDQISNLFIGYFTFTPIRLYRRDHFRHHQFVGVPSKDPDQYLHRVPRDRGSIWSFYMLNLLNRRSFINSLFGYWHELRPKEQLSCLALWIAMLLSITALWNIEASVLFLVLWFSARALVYYPVTVFREITEHSGKSGSLLSVARNVQGSFGLSVVFHPLCDAYHATHHFLPSIPWFNLPRAHTVLLKLPLYRKSLIECKGYFIGNNSAIKNWIDVEQGQVIPDLVKRA